MSKHYEEDLPCDYCGEVGAFYECGDLICQKCLEKEAMEDLDTYQDIKLYYDGERYY